MLFNLFRRILHPRTKTTIRRIGTPISFRRHDDESLHEFLDRCDRESKAHFAQFN